MVLCWQAGNRQRHERHRPDASLRCLGWSQATFASEVDVDGDSATVTREVDGGLADHQGQDANDRHS